MTKNRGGNNGSEKLIQKTPARSLTVVKGKQNLRVPPCRKRNGLVSEKYDEPSYNKTN